MSQDPNPAPAGRVGILTTDTDLVVMSWDAALERMTRISARGARGRSLLDIVPGLRRRPVLELLREPLVSGAAQVIAPALHKYLIACPPSEPTTEFEHMQQRIVSAALRDDRAIVGLVVTIEDVTARMEQERALSRMLRAADPADRMAAVKRLAGVSPVDGLGPLGGAMGDDDWQVRRAAVRALAARQDERLVDGIVAALREGHRDFSLLSSALQLLTLTGGDVTDALIRLMRDPDADLRIQAALALGTQRRPEAEAALLAALDDSDANVRFHAIEALGSMSAVAAIEPLTRIAESADFFLAFPAIEALIRINDPLAVPRLVPLLGNPLLAGSVASALGQIGDEDAVAPLVDALAHQAPVAETVDALAAIHDRYVTMFGAAAEIEDVVRRRLTADGLARLLDAIGTATGSTLRHLILVIGWIPDAAVPAALARVVGRADARAEVVEALVRCGAASVDLLIARLSEIDDATARDAITALGRIGDRRATLALIALLDERHRALWVPIANACARIGDPRAFEPLLPLLGDHDAGVRQATVGALNSIGHPDMAERIEALLFSDEPRVRESAVKVAGYFGYSNCCARVFDLSQDDDEGVRCAALEHAPYFDDSAAWDVLSRALASDTPRVRATAAKALGAMVGPQAVALLGRAIADSEPWVRYFAAGSLGRQPGASEAFDWLVRASADEMPHVRVAAVEALGAIGGPAVCAALTWVVGHDRGEAGHTAARLLGRLRSSEAIEPLLVVVRSADVVRRIAAVDGLAAHAGSRAIEQLLWTAEADAEGSVRDAALAGLATIANGASESSGAAVTALVGCLRESSLRDATIAALSHLRPAVIPLLADALSADDPLLRRGAAEALSRMTHPVASAALHRALDDGDEVVRRHAIVALSRIGSRELSRRLVSMARNDRSPAVRQAAEMALRRQRADQTDGAHA